MRHTARVMLLATAVAGCSTGPGDVGPLGGADGMARLCSPLPGVAPIVFGNETLRNDGQDPVTIHSVRLVGADGLALTGSFLLPIQNKVLLGTRTVPPNAGPWAKRRPATGATLEAQEEANLALLMDREPSGGSFSDVEVRYTSDGDRYTLRLASALKVVSTGPCPATGDQ